MLYLQSYYERDERFAERVNSLAISLNVERIVACVVLIGANNLPKRFYLHPMERYLSLKDDIESRHAAPKCQQFISHDKLKFNNTASAQQFQSSVHTVAECMHTSRENMICFRAAARR